VGAESLAGVGAGEGAGTVLGRRPRFFGGEAIGPGCMGALNTGVTDADGCGDPTIGLNAPRPGRVMGVIPEGVGARSSPDCLRGMSNDLDGWGARFAYSEG